MTPMMFSKVIFGNATVLKLIFIALGGALGSGIRARDTVSEFPLYTTLVGTFVLPGTTSSGEVCTESTLLLDHEFTWGIEDGLNEAGGWMQIMAPWLVNGDRIWITEIEFISGSLGDSWIDYIGQEQVEYSRRDLRITIRLDHDTKPAKTGSEFRLAEASFKDTLKTKIHEEFVHLRSRYAIDLTSGVKSFEINSSVPTTTTTTTTMDPVVQTTTATSGSGIRARDTVSDFPLYTTLVGSFILPATTSSGEVCTESTLLLDDEFTWGIEDGLNEAGLSNPTTAAWVLSGDEVWITEIEFISGSLGDALRDLRMTIRFDHDTNAAKDATEFILPALTKDTLKTKIHEEYVHLGWHYAIDWDSGVRSFEINSSAPTTPPAADDDADETETHTEEAAIFSSYATLVGKFTMSDSVTEGAQLLASSSFTIPIVRAVNASMPSSDVPSRDVYITAVEFLSSGRRLWWASSSSYDQDLRITIKMDHDTEAARTETEARMTEASFEMDFFTHLSIQWLNSTYDIVSITSFELNEDVTSTEEVEEAATMTVVVLIIIAAGVLLCIGGVVVLCARNFCCVAKSSSSLAPSVEVTNVTGDIEMGTNMTSFPSAQPVDIEMGTNIDQVQPTAPEPVLGEVVAV